MCKGSCRRTPTEGLAEYRRWQPVLPVRCPDGQAVLPHPVKQPSKMMQSASQSPLHGCAMLSPLCTRGAFFALRHTTGFFYGTWPGLHTTILFWGTLPGLQTGSYRCWLASAGAGMRSNAYSLGEFWVQRHAGPVAGRAQCLGSHTFFAFLHIACLARERSMTVEALH